ncbi:hypothetical protein K458DRAFT_486730 [Lentithecium fluviatile CBS 122367]|uniref:Uncharacterized protein n=1 Tax=Lentithecium fluviatile CBS 122367 TaxID=1168545 RepID=A0A6G1J4A6_9PLEO|nr:hypothetical protein K458DRAFT_486730 [Lentithecium fluviatile CBS 122367]
MKLASTLVALPALSFALAIPKWERPTITDFIFTPPLDFSLWNSTRIGERDSRWPWERPQPVIGEYPDGRKKCRTTSMTNGNIEGPCPPRPSDEEIQRILRAEWCRNNCCNSKMEPCQDREGSRKTSKDSNGNWSR